MNKKNKNVRFYFKCMYLYESFIRKLSYRALQNLVSLGQHNIRAQFFSHQFANIAIELNFNDYRKYLAQFLN